MVAPGAAFEGTMQARRRILTYWAVGITLLIGYLVMRMVHWHGNTQLHTVMEVIASLLALIVGALAITRFRSQNDNTFLFIGTGFVGAALLDGYHALVTSSYFAVLFPSVPSSLIPWSWVASRLLLSALLFISWWAWKREERLGDKGTFGERRVYLAVGFLTLSSFFFFAFVPLPRAYYPELFFHRPEEFIPAFFFLLALVGYLRKGRWRHDDFEHWLVISLIVGFMGQAAFMSFSGHLFDIEFDAAHLLKKISYIAVLIGLLINIYHIFRESEEQKEQLKEEISARNDAEAFNMQLAKENSILAEIGRVINSSLDIDSVMDDERATSRLLYVTGLDVTQGLEGKNVSLDPNLTRNVVRSRGSILVQGENPTEVAERYPGLAYGIKAGLRSFLAIPLISNNEIIGVLHFRSYDTNHFDPSRQDLAERIAAQISGAISNSQLLLELQRGEDLLREREKESKEMARENAVMADIGRLMNSSNDIGNVVVRFSEEVLSLIPFERISISLVDADAGTTSPLFVRGMEISGKEFRETVPLSNTYTHEVFSEGVSLLVVEDSPEDVLRLYPTLKEAVKAGVRSFLTVPLFSNNAAVGVLHLASTLIHAFTPHHQALAERIASQIAGAIIQSRLYQDLSKAEAELAGFFNLSLDMLCITGMDGSFKRVNAGFEKTLGYPKEELLSEHYLNLVHPEDIEYTRSVLERLAAGVPETHFENRFICQDGSSKWLAWTATPDVDNGVMYAGARDVTEHKRAEEALLHSETRLRAILDNVVDGIITIDQVGCVQSFSGAAETIFGYSADEVIGQNVTTLMTVPERGDHDSYLSDYARTGEAKIIGIGRQTEGRRKNGEVFPMDLAVSEMRLGDQMLFVGSVRDITEKVRAEKAFLDSYEQNNALLDAIPDMMFRADDQGVLLDYKPANDAALFVSPEVFLGKSVDDVLPQEVAELSRKAIADALSSSEPQIFEYQLPIEFQMRDFEARVTTSRDNEALLIVRDITERRAVDRMKDEFISVVSHELRTPLTSIRGSLGLMAGGALGTLPEQAKHMVEIAANNTERLVRLINDILDIERMESGKVTMDLQECDAAELVSEAAEVMREMAEEAGIALSVELKATVIWADRDRITQVLTNLISNAIKFSPRDSTINLVLKPRRDDLLF